MSQFRHPTSTPARTGGAGDASSGAFNMKPPKAPDRPLVPYMRFSRKMWSKVRADNPDAQLWDIGKVIGSMWRETAEVDKQVYQQEYDVEKIEYEKQMKTYQNSAPYQQYLAAKNRAKQTEKMSRNRALDSSGVVIQPVDEDEVHNELTARKVAHARFERNQRLLAELFNPQMVTDTRSIVGQSRIEMLRKQGQSLASHQAKLEEELKRLDEAFESKKRSVEKGSEEFAETLKKVCEEKPVMDETKFNDLVTEWEGKLAEAYVDYKKKQDDINAKMEAERVKQVKLTEKSTLFAMVADDADCEQGESKKEEESGEKAEEGESVEKADTEAEEEKVEEQEKVADAEQSEEAPVPSKDEEEPEAAEVSEKPVEQSEAKEAEAATKEAEPTLAVADSAEAEPATETKAEEESMDTTESVEKEAEAVKVAEPETAE